MTDRSPLFPLSICLVEWSLPFVSSKHRVCLTTHIYLFAFFLIFLLSSRPSPSLSLSVYHSFSPWNHQHCSQVPLLTQPVDSICGLSCTVKNRTKPNRSEHAWRSDERYSRSDFYFLPSWCSYARAFERPDFIGAAAAACMSIYSIAVH